MVMEFSTIIKIKFNYNDQFKKKTILFNLFLHNIRHKYKINRIYKYLF